MRQESNIIEVEIREMREGEEDVISELIEDVFSASVAPLFVERGRSEFRKYISSLEIAERHKDSNHFMLVAMTPIAHADIAGIIEVRNFNHISLFFVRSSLQGNGVGRILLQRAADICRENGFTGLTVNSSPNAVAAYERLGFIKLEDEKEENGIRFVPMKKDISSLNSGFVKE